ncbi:MAG: TatD family hydrolase [Haliangiales bacterium]
MGLESGMDLVDIGVNLTNRAFRDDLDEVCARAAAVGVKRMVITGTSVEESAAAAELAQRAPGARYATAGVHPHHASDHAAALATGGDAGGDGSSDVCDALRELAGRPEVVAIGECGLDYNRNFSPPAAQRRCFEAQVALAASLSMPLFVHEREASDDLLAILTRWRDRVPGAVVHCFTGDEAALDAYLALDLHIGITGWICDERRGTHLHPIIKKIPIDRLMIETDAPYLMPRTIRPRPKHRRNEPAHLPYVLATVAEHLGLPEAKVAAATTETAERFFGLR